MDGRGWIVWLSSEAFLWCFNDRINIARVCSAARDKINCLSHKGFSSRFSRGRTCGA